MREKGHKHYLMFGPRVSEATKQAMREQLGYEEIPADFGPFGSGAPFCELFPFYKDEREAFKKQHTGLSDKELKAKFTARYEAQATRLAGAHVIFVQSTGEQPEVADSIEQTRFAINSLKHYGAAEVTVAMPNIAYDRQDRGFNEAGRLCSLGSKWLAMDLKNYKADRIITFAPHSQANIDVWKDVFENKETGEQHYHPLQTTELFANYIRAQFPDTNNLVIGAPDGADKPNDRGIARAHELATAVSENPQMFKIGKAHVHASETKVTSFEGDVAGKDCVVVDDMSDGGSTLINAAKELKARGAKTVSVYFTHAICSEPPITKANYETLYGLVKAVNTSFHDYAHGVHKTALTFVVSIKHTLQHIFDDGTLSENEMPERLSPKLEAMEIKSSLRKLACDPNIDRIVTTDTVPEILAKREALEPRLRGKVEVLSIGPLLAQSLQQIIAQEKPGTAISGDDLSATGQSRQTQL